MKTSYDFLNRPRKTSLILCNPTGEELYSLGLAKEIELSLSMKEVSELTFTIPKYKDKTIVPYYDEVIERRVVKVDGIGSFLIATTRVTKNGIYEKKEVTCVSLEFEWASKTMGCEGTYKFYDPVDSTGTMMGLLLSFIPSWTIKEIDSELWSIYRTFDEAETTLYNFAKGNIEKAYDCIFIFDTLNKQVSVKKTNNALFSTNIFLSDRNLVKELQIEGDSKNIFTAVNVYGDGDLSIASVNPLGTTTMYEFTYYATKEWMGESLAQKTLLWQEKVDYSYNTFGALQTEIKNLNTSLIVKNSELYDLQAQKKALEQQLNLAVFNNSNTSATQINSQITAKGVEISNKQSEIDATQAQIETKTNQKKTINESLSFESNFTPEEYKKLSEFIYETSVTNDGFMQNEEDTAVDVQNMMEELWGWGKRELKRQSQPVYTLTLDVVDPMKLPEFKEYADELDLGAKITLCIDREKDIYTEVILLKYTTKLNNPNGSLQLEFANVLNYNSDKYKWDDLFDSAASMASQLNFESYKYKQGAKANAKIDTYMSHALDLTKQDLLASQNQEFVMNDLGIRGKEWDEVTQTYLPEQVWMTKNRLAFSDDRFNTIKQALGKIMLPDGTMGYGLIADHIIGKLVYSSALVCENENGSFRVDGSSVTIKNGNILMTSDDGKEITLAEKFLLEQNKNSQNLSDALENVYDDMKELEEAIGDGSIDIWYEAEEPKQATVGDLWYDTSDKNKGYLAKKGGIATLVSDTALCGTFTTNSEIIWTSIQDQNVLDALDKAQSAQTTADGKITTYYSATKPTTGSEGDIWINLSENKKQYRYTNEQWSDIQDGGIANAQTSATSALNKVNNVLTPEGQLDTKKLEGDILGGHNNILCTNGTDRALKLNENGLLIGNTKVDDDWNWQTAMSASGLSLGSGKFTVDFNGNCRATSFTAIGGKIQGGSITLGDVNQITMSDNNPLLVKNNGQIAVEIWIDQYDRGGTMMLGCRGEETVRVQAGEWYESVFHPKTTVISFGGVGQSQYGNAKIFGNQISVERGNLYVKGSISCSGTKPATVETESYGYRQLYSEEADRMYFNTYGNASTLIQDEEGCKITVNLDEIFMETIELNNTNPYLAYTTSCSNEQVWVGEVTDSTVTFHSNLPTKFNYQIKCLRKGYADYYLPETTKYGELIKEEENENGQGNDDGDL